MGFVLPTVQFAGVLLVAVLVLWMATLVLRLVRRSKQQSRPADTTQPWFLPHEPALPGIIADTVKLGDLSIRAASIAGPGPRSQEQRKPRQDAYRLAQDSAGDYLIVAVADGALPGGRPGLGAHLATTTVVHDLRRQLDLAISLEKLTAGDVFGRAAQSMVDGAHLRGIPIGSLYTTLITLVVPTKPNPDGSRTAWLAHIGHSSAWLNLGTRWQYLTAEISSDAAAVLPFQSEKAFAALVDLPAGAVVAVATDGLATAFTRLPNGHRRFAQNWRHPPPLGSFLLDVDYPGGGELTDDRTAVVLWCGAA